MPLIVATTPDQLDDIPIHDAWFDVDSLMHDADARTLTMLFAQDPDHTPELCRYRYSVERPCLRTSCGWSASGGSSGCG